MNFNPEVFLQSGVIFSSTADRVVVGWGARSWINAPSDKHPFSFYFPDFFLREKTPWFVHEQAMELGAEELKTFFANKNSYHSPIEWQSSPKEVFEKEFEKISIQFKKGNLQKAVPYIFETTEQFNAKQALVRSLCNLLDYVKQHRVYLYGFWSDREGMLGATPELLFLQKGRNIETMACAGTFPNTQKNRIENDPKIALEHQLVIDGIVENLSRFGDLAVRSTETLCFPPLCHRITPISLSLKNKTHFRSIVEALHPTPALGVYPKSNGSRWLEDYAKRHPRQRFGAPAGFSFSEEAATCYVAIRNIQWLENKAYLSAGCGVIPASRCDEEWNELQLKIQAIKRMLAL